MRRKRVKLLLGILPLFSLGILVGKIKSPTSPISHPPVLFVKNIHKRCDSLITKLTPFVESGVAIDLKNNVIFWQKEPEKSCKIASLTKLMVVLIVMEKIRKGELHLDTKIKVTKEASKMGGSQVYLKEGEVFTVEDLLKATIIASANDASYLLAQYISGTEEEFVRLMNQKAKQMGLNATKFVNSTGLPPDSGEHNVSSALDVAQIALKVVEFKKVKEWGSTIYDSFRGGKFELWTRNRLMRRCKYVDGLKTGYYPEAGWSLVATSLKTSPQVMVVVLGVKKHRWIRDKVAQLLIEYKLGII